MLNLITCWRCLIRCRLVSTFAKCCFVSSSFPTASHHFLPDVTCNMYMYMCVICIHVHVCMHNMLCYFIRCIMCMNECFPSSLSTSLHPLSLSLSLFLSPPLSLPLPLFLSPPLSLPPSLSLSPPLISSCICTSCFAPSPTSMPTVSVTETSSLRTSYSTQRLAS